MAITCTCRSVVWHLRIITVTMYVHNKTLLHKSYSIMYKVLTRESFVDNKAAAVAVALMYIATIPKRPLLQLINHLLKEKTIS